MARPPPRTGPRRRPGAEAARNSLDGARGRSSAAWAAAGRARGRRRSWRPASRSAARARSPRPATAGRSSRSWARPEPPGSTRAPPEETHAGQHLGARHVHAHAGAVREGPRARQQGQLDVEHRGRPQRARAGPATSPRARSATSRPARLTAARGAGHGPRPPTRRGPGARGPAPAGRRAAPRPRRPAASVPDTRVPVTTVPKPRRVKARSTGRRSRPSARARRRLARPASASASWSASRPWPRAGGDRAAPAAPPGTSRATSSRTSSSASGLAVRRRRASHLVRATSPRGIPRRRQMWKCSRVWGMTDSSAATTSSDRVDAVGAGQHVAHEALVAGHVDERGDEPVPEVEVGEAEVDGDAPLLLLLQAVGVGAGEGADEGALAVVDVAGRADDQRAQGRVRLSSSAWSRRRRTRRSCGAWRRGPGAPPSRRAR